MITTAVILAGGKGSRLSEETKVIPKPMLEVGELPLLQHIINIFIVQGVSEIIVAAGYKQAFIVSYFLENCEHYTKHTNMVEFGFPTYSVKVVDTGLNTLTGGRILRLKELINSPFFMTYGDGVGNVNLSKVESKFSGMGVVTAVHPVGRFGAMSVDRNGKVVKFGEKEDTVGWVNGGFFALHPDIFGFIADDFSNFEKDVIPLMLKRDGKLVAHFHDGFWKCVDTLRDLEELRDIYYEQGAIWLNL